MINYDNIAENPAAVLNLQDMLEVAYRVWESIPTVEELSGEMLAPQILGETQFDDIMANAIIQRALFHRWPDMPVECFWQLSYRLQYVKDTLQKMIELGEEKALPVVQSCVTLALTAAYSWHVNAVLWIGDYCAADAVTNDLGAWPDLAGEEYPIFEQFVARYQTYLDEGTLC